MRLKVFTLRLDPATGRFDDREVDVFQADREILDVSDFKVVHDGQPLWGLLVRWREPADGRSQDNISRKDWRGELDGPGQRLYDELRLWRSRVSKRDGLPPYLVLTNREVAEIARRRPATSAALQEIDGVGESKSKRWGEEILAVLASVGEGGGTC